MKYKLQAGLVGKLLSRWRKFILTKLKMCLFSASGRKLTVDAKYEVNIKK